MTLNVFIDTNIFLSFFSYSSDDIEKLKIVAELIKEKKIQLLMTAQVMNEFYRNRESKIQEALNAFEKTLPKATIPVCMRHYNEVKDYESNTLKLKVLHNKMYESTQNDSMSSSLPGDILFKNILANVSIISIEEDIINKAKQRCDLGNPPGKDKSLGDAINWEILLNIVPLGEKLHLITQDKDFASSLDNRKPHPFLIKEWKDKRSSEFFLYSGLSEFFREHFPTIKVPGDITKQNAVENLIGSNNFSYTHRAIIELKPYLELLTDEDRNALIEAALTNKQISLIASDSDVNELYKELLLKLPIKYPKDKLMQLNAIFGWN